MADAASGALPAQTHPLSLDERRALGRSMRKQVSRGQHAEWMPARDRQDPIEILIEQGRTRLPQLLPLQIGRAHV